MIGKSFYICCFFLTLVINVFAQQNTNQHDTFFLAKKKGLLGRIGKSLNTTPAPEDSPQKVENQFLQYQNKIIRNIEIYSLGFQRNIYDTSEVNYNFGIRLANLFHKNSKEKVIKNNLFFKEGSRLLPNLVADNERYLRDIVFIQDARIIVEFVNKNTDSVDIIVLTKDVFSIGGNLKIDDKTRGRIELKEENIAGSGNRLFLSGLYDEARSPIRSLATEITARNIKGSFINWTTGFNNFSPSFTNGKWEETKIYTSIEKPMVSQFMSNTGSLALGYFNTKNNYNSDSIYRNNYDYNYYNIDGWLGYNLDRKPSVSFHREILIHKFVAIRAFNQHFFNQPTITQTIFDYRFTNYYGALATFNIFKQLFYKTNFIYGFGRNEDVPEGFSIALTSGWIKQQQASRPYGSLDFGFTHFNKKGLYSNYTFRAGGYIYRNRFEDMDLLFNIEHFTKLKKINNKWYQRTFLTTGITAQVNSVFNSPLFLNSQYGLPYFNPDGISSDLRYTTKFETVFFNNKKYLGFKFAPFMFSDFCLLKPLKQNLDKTDLFSAIGGGVRTRNENLTLGTVELKCYYFPRTNRDMTVWKIEVNSNIRFKYNSSFIKRPDFVVSN